MDADGIHLVFLFSFNKLTWLRNEIGAKLECLSVQREEKCMEDSIHFSSGRQAKAVGVGEYDLRNFQLSRGKVDFQVTRV